MVRNLIGAMALAAGGLLVVLLLGGCHNCENLIEKVCTDLGAADCALWKKHGLDRSWMPTGRGVNRACGMMSSDAAYPGVLKGARQQVEALRRTEKAKAAAALKRP